MMIITRNFDYFFGVFWGGALGGLNLFLHSIEINSIIKKKDFSITGNYITRYSLVGAGLFVAGAISFSWLLGSVFGLFLYLPAIYIATLQNTIYERKG